MAVVFPQVPIRQAAAGPACRRDARTVGDVVSAIDRLTAALADRYRIERELEQGGMATVYLA